MLLLTCKAFTLLLETPEYSCYANEPEFRPGGLWFFVRVTMYSKNIFSAGFGADALLPYLMQVFGSTQAVANGFSYVFSDADFAATYSTGMLKNLYVSSISFPVNAQGATAFAVRSYITNVFGPYLVTPDFGVCVVETQAVQLGYNFTLYVAYGNTYSVADRGGETPQGESRVVSLSHGQNVQVVDYQDPVVVPINTSNNDRAHALVQNRVPDISASTCHSSFDVSVAFETMFHGKGVPPLNPLAAACSLLIWSLLYPRRCKRREFV